MVSSGAVVRRVEVTVTYSRSLPDFFGYEFVASPYPGYAQLREERPVCRIQRPDGLEVWLLTRYADVRAALADPRLSKDPRHAAEQLRQAGVIGIVKPDGRVVVQHMANSDPPDHTRLRSLLSKAFTTRRVEALRPRVHRLAHELIDAFAQHGHAEVIAEFAHPLPLIVNCELLGIPADPARHLHDLGGDAAYPSYVNAAPAGSRGSSPIRDFLADQIAAKRKGVIGTPEEQPDLLSTLIAARDRDDRLTEDELLGMAVLLFIAGFETTVSLIGNATLALVTHPGQLTLLRDRPNLLPSAVEEFLRYDSPLEKATFRVATEDVEYSGTTLPKGAIIALILGSANRDPQFCADPDVLDITRATHGHLGFGHGLHFCLGAPLARMEVEIAIGALLQRCPDLELAVPEDQLHWRIGLIHRGLRTLPVRFRPSEPRNGWPDAP